jgi:hypothetical protein
LTGIAGFDAKKFYNSDRWDLDLNKNMYRCLIARAMTAEHGLPVLRDNRTGRWTGRLIQMQNPPQNHLDTAKPNGEDARTLILAGDYEHTALMLTNIPSILSQLIHYRIIT